MDPQLALTTVAAAQAFNHTHQVDYPPSGPFDFPARTTSSASAVGSHSHTFDLAQQSRTFTGSELTTHFKQAADVSFPLNPRDTVTGSSGLPEGYQHDHSTSSVTFTTTTEFHYNAPFQQSLVSGQRSGLHESQLNFDLLMFDWNGGGKPDLIAVKRFNTGSNTTELHGWSGESNFQTKILETATSLPEADESWQFAMGGYRDLIAIHKEPGRGKTEMSVLTYGSHEDVGGRLHPSPLRLKPRNAFDAD